MKNSDETKGFWKRLREYLIIQPKPWEALPTPVFPPYNPAPRLRDEFAGLAMQALFIEMASFEDRAKWAYQQADAMLAERDKKEQERYEKFVRDFAERIKSHD